MLINFLILAGGVSIHALDASVYDWNDTHSLFNELSSNVLADPMSPELSANISVLVKLVPAMGRDKVTSLLEEALKKIESSGGICSQPWFIVMNALIVTGGTDLHRRYFAQLDEWTLSGTWKRYGGADIDYSFSPERDFSWKNLSIKRINSKGNRLFPFSKYCGEAGVVYARTSFSGGGALRLWILADSECRVFINDRDQGLCRGTAKGEMPVYRLTGAANYSVVLKFYSDGFVPASARVLVTGDRGGLPDISWSGGRITPVYPEKMDLVLPGDDARLCGGEAQGELGGLIGNGMFGEALKRGGELLALYPGNYFLYKQYARVLSALGMGDELVKLAAEFRNVFPDSRSASLWLAEYFSAVDRALFIKYMQEADPAEAEPCILLNYLYALAASGGYEKAVKLAGEFISSPTDIYTAVASIYRIAGKKKEMRAVLLEGAAATGDPGIYFLLGCSDEAAGLDPVIYWSKALDSEDMFCDVSDMIDVYENSSARGKVYYSGWFSGERAEFRTGEIRRKIKLHVFESGTSYMAVTDFIPRRMLKKNAADGIYRHRLAGEGRGRVLYALQVTDASVDPAMTAQADGGSVDITLTGDCSYVVVEYSSRYNAAPGRITFVDIPVVGRDEFVEDLEVEVVYHGAVDPLVSINDAGIRGKRDDGMFRYKFKDRFSGRADDAVKLRVRRFGSHKTFTGWYADLAEMRGRFTSGNPPVIPGGMDMHDVLLYLHGKILSAIKTEGETDFNPRRPESVIASKNSTPEEKALLAMAILERAGIRSYMAFGLCDGGSVIDTAGVLLFVPVNAGDGYWIDTTGGFYDAAINGDKTVVVVSANGSWVQLVEPDRIIKE